MSIKNQDGLKNKRADARQECGRDPGRLLTFRLAVFVCVGGCLLLGLESFRFLSCIRYQEIKKTTLSSRTKTREFAQDGGRVSERTGHELGYATEI